MTTASEIPDHLSPSTDARPGLNGKYVAHDNLAEARPKAEHLGTHRALPLQDTLERVAAKTDVIGITRVGDLTDYDVLRIPNYAAVAPMVNYPPRPGCISVFTGKGLTKQHAKVSALMEAAERYSCLRHDRFAVRESYRVLSARYNVAHPGQFVVVGSHEYHDDQAAEWVFATSLSSGATFLVPAFAVFTPNPNPPGVFGPPSSTNGLASGNTVEEATLHALYEAIERDAEAIATASGSAPSLDLGSVTDPALRDLIDRFVFHGVQLEVKDITHDLGVPTYLAICVDWEQRNINYVNGGKGTHLDPVVALSRAVTEASQSRVTGIAGIREDMEAKRAATRHLGFDELYRSNRHWYEPGEDRRRFDEAVDRSTFSIAGDLALVLDLLRTAGIPDVWAVDLTRPELGIPVVKVLVPLLEFAGPGNWMGQRCRRALRGEGSA